jgi:hypothetical protein
MNDNDYVDRTDDDAPEWRPVGSDKRQLYPEVPGMSEAQQPIEEKPKQPRRLPRSVRDCCAHPATKITTGSALKDPSP